MYWYRTIHDQDLSGCLTLNVCVPLAGGSSLGQRTEDYEQIRVGPENHVALWYQKGGVEI